MRDKDESEYWLAQKATKTKGPPKGQDNACVSTAGPSRVWRKMTDDRGKGVGNERGYASMKKSSTMGERRLS